MVSRHQRSLLVAGGFAVVIAATLTAKVGGDDVTTNEPEFRAELRAISTRVDGAFSTVLIESSEPVAYVTSQPDPLTVIVDLRNVKAGELPPGVLGPTPPVTNVRVEEAMAGDGAIVARVRVSLAHAAKHRVRSSRNVIYVEVDRPVVVHTPSTARGTSPSATPVPGPSTALGASPSTALGASKALPKTGPSTSLGASPSTTLGASPSTPPEVGAPLRAGKPALTPVPSPRPESTGNGPGVSRGISVATSITAIRALPMANGVGISVVGDGQLIAASVEQARDMPPRVLLDFRGVSARGLPAVTEIKSGIVQRVRVGTNSLSPLVTRVVIDLERQGPYRIQQAGANSEEVQVLFEDPPSVLSAPVAAPPAPASARPEPTASVGGPSAPSVPSAPSIPVFAQPPTPVAVIEQPPVPAPDQVVGTGRFTGHTVTLDFQGADLRSVLRTFAEISGLNIVIDPTINGTVDVSLRDVPWDQALDIILKANKLGYAIDGTVVRIAPLLVLAQEQEEERKLNDAKALSGELRVLTLPLSYAKADQLVAILTRSALSPRGEVQVDMRTNTLIIRDLGDRLTTATELVKALDRPQPQVEIEARVVQTTRAFARQMGIQWGFNGRVDPTLGNTTGLAFPNSGSLSGRVGGPQGPASGGSSADNGINLGAPAPSTAIGIALGAVNGALNLDVVLSQLESSGRGRVLSTPRVSTQNNIEAEMTQGVQIPIQTVANNTVTVSFKDAALTLRVTPQITASNTIIMRVFLENAQADFGRAINGIPPIDTQRAVTTVLVADGETTVIGGIYVSIEQASQGRVPLLHRVPLLGWLFRRDVLSDESRELLIFITPRITKS